MLQDVPKEITLEELQTRHAKALGNVLKLRLLRLNCECIGMYLFRAASQWTHESTT